MLEVPAKRACGIHIAGLLEFPDPESCMIWGGACQDGDIHFKEIVTGMLFRVDTPAACPEGHASPSLCNDNH